MVLLKRKIESLPVCLLLLSAIPYVHIACELMPLDCEYLSIISLCKNKKQK